MNLIEKILKSRLLSLKLNWKSYQIHINYKLHAVLYLEIRIHNKYNTYNNIIIIGNILFKKASKCMFFKSFEKCSPNVDNIIFEKEINQLNNCYFQFYNKEEDKINI